VTLIGADRADHRDPCGPTRCWPADGNQPGGFGMVADGVLDIGQMPLHAGSDVLTRGKNPASAAEEHTMQPQPFAQIAAVAECILQLRMRLVKRDATFANLDRRLAAILTPLVDQIDT